MNTAELLKELGASIAMTLNSEEMPESVRNQQVISSGNVAIDVASGIGGLPKNRLIEIFGNESSGKTTVTLQAAAEITKSGRFVLFADMEYALDIEYAMALGVDPDKFIITQPDSAEELIRIMYRFLECDDCGMIIVDSLAALSTQQELEGEVGDANIATRARILAQNVKRLCAKASVNDTMLFFVNQNRERPGVMYGNPVYQPGGRAVKYAASMRIEIKRKTTNKEGQESVSNETEITFVKNKLAPPYKKATFDIEFGKGADNTSALLKLGTDLKAIEKVGSTFCFKGVRIGVGKTACVAAISANSNLRKQIWEEVRRISSKDKNKIEKPVRETESKEEKRKISVTEKPSTGTRPMRRMLSGDE